MNKNYVLSLINCNRVGLLIRMVKLNTNLWSDKDYQYVYYECYRKKIYASHVFLKYVIEFSKNKHRMSIVGKSSGINIIPQIKSECNDEIILIKQSYGNFYSCYIPYLMRRNSDSEYTKYIIKHCDRPYNYPILTKFLTSYIMTKRYQLNNEVYAMIEHIDSLKYITTNAIYNMFIFRDFGFKYIYDNIDFEVDTYFDNDCDYIEYSLSDVMNNIVSKEYHISRKLTSIMHRVCHQGSYKLFKFLMSDEILDRYGYDPTYNDNTILRIVLKKNRYSMVRMLMSDRLVKRFPRLHIDNFDETMRKKIRGFMQY
jgi:hypothetical protein